MGENDEFSGPKQHYRFLQNESMQFCYFSNFGYELEYLAPIVKDLIFNKKITLKHKKNIDLYENPSLSIFPGKRFKRCNFYIGDPLKKKMEN